MNMRAFKLIFLISIIFFFFRNPGSVICQTNSQIENDEYLLSWRKLESPSVNFGFDDDSLAIWFQPLGACSLKSVRLYNVNFKGQLTLDIWQSPYKGHIVSTDSVGSLGKIGIWLGDWQPANVFKISPLGNHIWGPKTITITQSDTNKWIEIALAENLPFINGQPFIIGFYCKRDDGWGFGAEDEGTVPFHFFRSKCNFYVISEWPGWYIDKWSIWLESVIKYITDTRPQITNISLIKTQQMNKGPFQVYADIIDFNPIGGDSGVKSAKLFYVINQEDTLFVAMNPQGNDTTFIGHIPQLDSYDFTIHYWIEAEDVNGNISKSYTQFFYGLGPISQPILVIGDYGRVINNLPLEQMDQWFLRALRGEYNPLKKYDYFLWDKWRLKCFPAIEMLQHVHTILWYTGISSESDFLYLPIRSDSNAIARFVDRGGNLLLQDQINLVRSYYLWEPPLNFELPERNFFRDYLGVKGFYENTYQQYMYGMPGNELTGDSIFIDLKYHAPRIPPDDRYLYLSTEYAYPFAPTENAEVIFTSDQDSCLGVRVINPNGSSGKTVFIASNLMAFKPTQPGYQWPEQHDQFLLNVLEWFGTPTSIRQEENKIPQGFLLSQNYPNPFNTETQIYYQLPEDCSVTLIIYNVSGQNIRTLVSEKQSAGNYTVLWNGKDDHGSMAASGLYLYKLNADRFNKVNKMVLLR